MIHKILRLLINTLTVDEKHYLLTRENLTQTIQIQLSQKQKTFFLFVFAFLKSKINFKHLLKNVTLIADVFSEKLGPENMVRKMSKNPFSDES